MSVDVFGRINVENMQKVFSAGVTFTEINNAFLRRDGENTATDNRHGFAQDRKCCRANRSARCSH